MKKILRLMLSLMLLGAVFGLTSCMSGSQESNVSQSGQDDIISTPTPQLTATPGIIGESIAEIAETTGLNREMLLGLTGEDWVNFGISVAIFFVGVLIISWIVRFVIGRIVRATPGTHDDEFYAAIKRQINVLIGVLLLDYATDRLVFVPVEVKEALNQIYFASAIITLAYIVWKLIDLLFIWQSERYDLNGEVDDRAAVRSLFRRFLRGVVVIFTLIIVLSNYGINPIFILSIIFGFVVATLIAGQNILSDLIYGFVLLFERPFEVGDRIEIKDLETWGDVVDIGIRTTRVCTLDNRLVVHPNSLVGRSLLVNFSQPTAQFRAKFDIDVAYGVDPEKVQEVVEEAIRIVEGVAVDKEIDVLLNKISKSGLEFRLRWWLVNYADASYVGDQVLRSVYAAMLQSGIEMSLDAYDLNIFMDGEISPS